MGTCSGRLRWKERQRCNNNNDSKEERSQRNVPSRRCTEGLHTAGQRGSRAHFPFNTSTIRPPPCRRA
jgi:hypothetical protein